MLGDKLKFLNHSVPERNVNTGIMHVALDHKWYCLGQSPRNQFSSYLCLRQLIWTSLITLNVSVTSPYKKTNSWRKKIFIKSLWSSFLKYQNFPLKTQLFHSRDSEASSDRHEILNGPQSLAPYSHKVCSELWEFSSSPPTKWRSKREPPSSMHHSMLLRRILSNTSYLSSLLRDRQLVFHQPYSEAQDYGFLNRDFIFSVPFCYLSFSFYL